MFPSLSILISDFAVHKCFLVGVEKSCPSPSRRLLLCYSYSICAADVKSYSQAPLLVTGSKLHLTSNV